LESWFNPQAKRAINDFKEGGEISLDQVNLSLLTTATVNEPTAFDEAWNCEDKEHRKIWREAINKELSKMTKKEVSEVINQEYISKDRRCIKSKWIIITKRNGVFCARLVACGLWLQSSTRA
jgi:hypothetical protein